MSKFLAIKTPDEALSVLKQGNKRFAGGKTRHPHLTSARLRETYKNGQKPIATVLACSDSRVPVEYIFDRGIGDIFVIRVAGNVCGNNEAGSIEYAVEHLETPLVVVLGHNRCGAVTAVATETPLYGNILHLAANIKPVVEKAGKDFPNLEGEELVEEVVKANVWKSIEDLFKASPVICKRVKSGKLRVIGAVYRLDKGQVDWLGSHPEQAELLSHGFI